jgi:hypothetical protein
VRNTSRPPNTTKSNECQVRRKDGIGGEAVRHEHGREASAAAGREWRGAAPTRKRYLPEGTVTLRSGHVPQVGHEIGQIAIAQQPRLEGRHLGRGQRRSD